MTAVNEHHKMQISYLKCPKISYFGLQIEREKKECARIGINGINIIMYYNIILCVCKKKHMLPSFLKVSMTMSFPYPSKTNNSILWIRKKYASTLQ